MPPSNLPATLEKERHRSIHPLTQWHGEAPQLIGTARKFIKKLRKEIRSPEGTKKQRHTYRPTVPKEAHVSPHSPKGTLTHGLHSPEGTQAYSRQPGLAVSSTIDSESSEGAQADHASPTAPSPKKQFCPAPFQPNKPPSQDPTVKTLNSVMPTLRRAKKTPAHGPTVPKGSTRIAPQSRRDAGI